MELLRSIYLDGERDKKFQKIIVLHICNGMNGHLMEENRTGEFVVVYSNLYKGVFLERLNRFVARVEIDGEEQRVHVKNTGRCAELLVPGNAVYLEKIDATGRKTAFDLVAVEKRGTDGVRLVNINSMAPNRAAAQWLADGGIGPLEDLRAEVTLGDSRFDFCATQDGRRVVVEVKGCTLEEDGVARFPDAPTLRGVKHVCGLTELSKAGCRCVVLIVIQMKGVSEFRPNWATHPEFGWALRQARDAGVEILAMDCVVNPEGMRIDAPVPVNLDEVLTEG